jgi:cell wall-associated NlpC family hydrolase
MRVAALSSLVAGLSACSACGGASPRQDRAAPPAAGAAGAASAAGAAGAAGAAEADDDAASEEGDEALPVAVGTSPTLLAEIDRELAAVKSTTYSHRLLIDEGAGRFEYDCSGFVGYALRRVRAGALEPIPHPGKRRPLAAHFQAYFALLGEGGGAVPGGGRWERVARVAEIAPGDVIAWKKPASSRSRNTGHVLVARGAARPDPGRPGTLLVDVADSTAIAHGVEDARRLHKTSGLGTGTIGLVVDASGEARAYRWSPGGPPKETAIAIGRLR